MRLHPRLILSPCLLLICPQAKSQPAPGTAAYTVIAGTYSQSFDGLPATGSFSLLGKGPISLAAGPVNASNLTGWQLWMYAGSNANAGFLPGTGSGTGNGAYSFGSSGSAERCLGSLSSSTGIYSMGLVLTNLTGSVLNRFTLAFTAEQWRKGGSAQKNYWRFRYKTGQFTSINQPNTIAEPNLDFSSAVFTSGAGSLNGNLAANQQAISYTVTGIKWLPGEQLLLRWDDTDESGNDDGMGIDNLSFTAAIIADPPSISTIANTAVTQTEVTLSATVDDHFAHTGVLFECDTSLLFHSAMYKQSGTDSIKAGTGNTVVTGKITGLAWGTRYYYRCIASNTKGTVQSNTSQFVTPVHTPEVITHGYTSNQDTFFITGEVSNAGGSFVTERGIVWAVGKLPVLDDTRIIEGKDTGKYTAGLTGLPAGSIIYIKAYAVNTGGVAYGDSIRIITPAIIETIRAIQKGKTNASAINFVFKTVQPVSGISAANFTILSQGPAGTFIKNVDTGNGGYIITVVTGSGDGTMAIQFSNDSGLSIPVKQMNNRSDWVQIDKSPPVIRAVSIPNKTMKIGDTVAVKIEVLPDTELYQFNQGTIHSYPLSGVSKLHDSAYIANFVVTAGAKDMDAADDIPVYISFADSAGNTGEYSVPLHQGNDALDANRPLTNRVKVPANGLYKSGDTLFFIFFFNERIWIRNGTPSLSLTIGTKTKTASYKSGSGSDTLLFSYTIRSGDLDTNGIKTAGTITLNKSLVTDNAGNNAILGFSNSNIGKGIQVDAVIPVANGLQLPMPGKYLSGDSLSFLVHYSKSVWVKQKDSMPSIAISMGNTIRRATCYRGSGTSDLLFSYVIAWNDVDTNGIQLSDVILDTQACITDAAGNIAGTSIPDTGDIRGILINPPTIRLLSVTPPAAGWYKNGDTLAYRVRFNEAVWVKINNNPPYIKAAIGNANRQVKYSEGSGSNTLVFRYVIQSSDSDTDGVQTTNSIFLNGSMLKDTVDNDVPLTFSDTVNTSVVLIDAIAPALKNVRFISDTWCKAADTISIILSFTEPVFWENTKDTPFVTLNTGGIPHKLYGDNKTGQDRFTFSYIVQYNDQDKEGISINNKISIAGNTLTDKAGNKASLSISPSFLKSNTRIDARPPLFLQPNDERIEQCMSRDSTRLTSFLTVVNSETSELLSWKYAATGHAGKLSQTNDSITSNGKNNIPRDLYFIPDGDKSGTDTIYLLISDGLNQSAKKITLQIYPRIENNQVRNAQVICKGEVPLPLEATQPTGGNNSYRYVWETAADPDSVNFSALKNISTAALSVGNVQTTSWYRRRVVSGMCSDTSAPVKIKVLTAAIWRGNADHNWHNSGNWCLAKIPDALADTYIYPGTLYEPVISETALCKNLYILTTASLQLSGILQLYGNVFTADAAIDAINGSIQLKGDSLQTIHGSMFKQKSIKSLIIDNSAGTNLDDSLHITQSVQLKRGSLETNNKLVLNSSARIAASASGTQIRGGLTALHLVQGGKRVFRLLGNPFREQLPLYPLSQYMDITGENGNQNGFTLTASNQPSAFRYEPLMGNDSTGIDAGWIPFTNTNGQNENAWKALTAIHLFFRGSKGQGLDGKPAGDGRNGTYLPGSVELALSGTPVHGDLLLQLPKYRYGTYHSVANPYLSNINMQLVSKGRNIGDYYWLWNPQQGKQGGYTAYPFRCTNIIPPFGGLLVKSNGNSSNTLFFTEHAKTEAACDSIVPLPGLDDIFYADLRLESDSIFWDRILLLAMDSARNAFDNNDAEKFINSEVDFYSLSSNQQWLSIDARPMHNETVIPLGIQTKTPGSFQIRIAKAVLPISNTLLLHDKLLDRWTSLATDSFYRFTVTADSTSYGNNRFEISSRKPVAVAETSTSITTAVWPVPARDQLILQMKASEKGNTRIRIISAAGLVIKEFILGKQKEAQFVVPVRDLPAGNYVIETRCGLFRSTKLFYKL